MRIDCEYTPTIMDGPVIRWSFGRNRKMANLNGKPDWSAEISASRNGVLFSGETQIMDSDDAVRSVSGLLRLALDAHLRIKMASNEHATAKKIVEEYHAPTPFD